MSTSVHPQSPGQPGSDRREAHHDTLARQTGAHPIDHPALETPVETPSQRGGLDKVVFGVTAAIALAFLVWGFVDTASLGDTAGKALDWTVTTMGWLFVLTASAFVVFVI